VVYILIRKKITAIGLSSVEENFKLYKTADEAISGIKDIKLHGSYKSFVNQFFYPSKVLAKYGSQSTLFATLPRFLLEIVAFGGIISIVIWLVSSSDSSDTSSILPILSLYVMIGYRLMPALQQIYAGITKIKYNLPAFESILKEFSIMSDKEVELTKDDVLEFKKQFSMRNLSFFYENTSVKVLNNININIDFNSSVAIVGSTGSGKTTLIDILLGLLYSQDGKMLVDGVEINNHNISSWQKNIGYVPQSIYLIDDTIEENIAFASLGNKMNFDQVVKAAKHANLHEFIVSLPEQYKTIVGERGVRLSGGQCQRIGIARALYNDPQVLVLDEATSSLDGVTENAIMDAIKNLSHKKTIIMIAHRLSTIQECDNIYLMSNGKIVDSGNYEDLLDNKEFQKMAKMP
jgi:ABC-type multidrug transport system fused ATPase/permease subunit